MAVEPVFEKELKDTDVTYRLSFPTEHLGILPRVADERAPVEFPVRCGEIELTFRCRKRVNGYLKPFIEYGWSAVVRRFRLQVGDILKFYMEESDGGRRYWIEVYRWEYHSDEYGTSSIRHQIV